MVAFFLLTKNKRRFLLGLVFLFTSGLFAQSYPPIQPENITIIRDTFGVPHIFAYAKAYPKKVKVKAAFPITEKDIAAAYVVMLSFLSSAHKPLGDAVAGKYDNKEVDFREEPKHIGSNAYAVSPAKSAELTYVSIRICK
ncbi:MAG: hypothetical protein ACKVTZ_15355 [Bacteroidia bacterium]